VSMPTMSSSVDERGSMNGSKGYDFDVFVSYCDADREWAQSELIDPLLRAEIKLIHKGEFELGIDRLVNIENAVERSRKVIVVVSPAWLDSGWETFAALLALAPRPEGILFRLIPLIATRCELPARISKLESIDFSKPKERKECLDRLLRNLGRSSQQINEASTRDVRRGIVAWAEILSNQNVQVYLNLYEEYFTEASRLIGVLNRYKGLHDCFHNAENAYKQLLERRKSVAEGKDTWDRNEESAGELVNELTALLYFARRAGFPPGELLWTGQVERMCSELLTAVQRQDDRRLGAVCLKLLVPLGKEPSRTNDKLKTIARELALGGVADTLWKIHAEVADTGFDEEAQARLGAFTRGIDSLVQLDRNLSILINNHDCLQAFDDLLRSFELNDYPDPAEIADVWLDLTDPLGLLDASCGGTWIAGLVEQGQKLSAMLATSPTGPKEIRSLQASFRQFRLRVFKRFITTDVDLLNFCQQLQELGETLSAAIDAMKGRSRG